MSFLERFLINRAAYNELEAGGGGGDGGSAEAPPSGGDKGASDDAGNDNASPPSGAPDNFNEIYRSHILNQFPEGDERTKAQKYLERRASPVDVVRSGMTADSKIRELQESANQRIKPPTADSTPEDLESFRQAMGIPSDFKEYKGFRPDGVELSPSEVAMEERYFQFAHENHMTPDQVEKNMGFLYAYQEKQAEERQAMVAKASERAEDTLRMRYGTEFREKKALGESYLKSALAPHMGGNQQLGDLLNRRFDDGTALGEDPAFFGWVIEMAQDSQDGGTLDVTMNGGSGMDIDGRIKELRAMAHSPDHKQRKEYQSPAVQQEIKGLIARQMRQQKR